MVVCLNSKVVLSVASNKDRDPEHPLEGPHPTD